MIDAPLSSCSPQGFWQNCVSKFWVLERDFCGNKVDDLWDLIPLFFSTKTPSPSHWMMLMCANILITLRYFRGNINKFTKIWNLQGNFGFRASLDSDNKAPKVVMTLQCVLGWCNFDTCINAQLVCYMTTLFFININILNC